METLLDFFWLILWIFLFVAWIWVLITIITDLFSDKDSSGWAKALWVLLIIVLPLIGSLVYLIARGGGMAERSEKRAQAQQQQFDAYVRQAAGTSGQSTADELTKLAQLRDNSTITEDEFQEQKAKLLATA
jgi:uncharacterized membrane protein YcjF (UPF0283 family)